MNSDAAGVNHVAAPKRQPGDPGRPGGPDDADRSRRRVELTVAFPGAVTSTNGERVDPDAVPWKLKPGVVSTMTAQARYTDPNTRSFTRSGRLAGYRVFRGRRRGGATGLDSRDRSARSRRASRDQTGQTDSTNAPAGQRATSNPESARAKVSKAGPETPYVASRWMLSGKPRSATPSMTRLYRSTISLRFCAGSPPANVLTNACSSATAAFPGSWMSQLIRPTRLSIFGTKPNDSRISGRWSVVFGELGQETHDRVGIQQLGHAVGRALVALEIEPALFALAGGDQDHAAVGQQLAIDRQRVGGRDAGALAVVHRARDADEDDTLDPGVGQVGEPPAQGRLVHECGDLGAQAVHARQLGLDDRPEVQHVQLRLHRTGTVVVLGDHAGDHHVANAAVEPDSAEYRTTLRASSSACSRPLSEFGGTSSSAMVLRVTRLL